MARNQIWLQNFLGNEIGQKENTFQINSRTVEPRSPEKIYQVACSLQTLDEDDDIEIGKKLHFHLCLK